MRQRQCYRTVNLHGQYYFTSFIHICPKIRCVLQNLCVNRTTHDTCAATQDRCCWPKCRHVKRFSLAQKCVPQTRKQAEADTRKSVQNLKRKQFKGGIASKTDQEKKNQTNRKIIKNGNPDCMHIVFILLIFAIFYFSGCLVTSLFHFLDVMINCCLAGSSQPLLFTITILVPAYRHKQHSLRLT